MVLGGNVKPTVIASPSLSLHQLSDLAVGVEFALYIEDWENHRYMRIERPLYDGLMPCVQVVGAGKGSYFEMPTHRPVYADQS